MNKIAIDGRMWGSGFTGIGNYLQETVPRLFRLLPDERFALMVTPETADRLEVPPTVEVIPCREKIYSAGEQTSFFLRLSRSRPDLAWFPHFNVPLLYRAPFIATIHDLTILRYPGKKMAKPWHRAGYRRVLHHALGASAHLIAVSDYTQSEVIAFDPTIAADKITVIPNGIDRERFRRLPADKVEEFRFRFGPRFFLIAGVWREHKNIIGAIEAFEMFRKYGGKGALVITGRPDPFYPEVEQAVLQSKYAADIHLAGFVPDELMPVLMQAASALLFPSFAEGFGLPALEAMAAGTPVAASNASSLPEVCGDAAVLFDPHNPEDIALKMVDILEDKLRKRLIAAGRKRVREFSWEKTAEATAAVIMAALSEQK